MITLLSVSDGHKHFSTPIDEYKKRTDKYLKHISLRPVSHTNSEYIVVKETLAIMEALKKLKGTVYLLDERGKSLTTRAFTELIEDARNKSEDLIFIIGGSYGVDIEIFSEMKPNIIKISDFVMPHGLAYLVLLEQIYRAHEIMKGSGYHHQ